jgi:hypothetical protein
VVDTDESKTVGGRGENQPKSALKGGGCCPR